jgi:1-acyl-sn-glycerol-3-phosphate acyltransferase
MQKSVELGVGAAEAAASDAVASPCRLPPAIRPDPASISAAWRRLLDLPPSPAEDLYTALILRFTGAVRIEDPAAVDSLAGRPVLFLANHQTMIESPLFMMLATGLFGGLVSAVAHVQHRESWLGRLLEHYLAYPGVADPGVMFFFDDHDQRRFMREFDDLRRFLLARRRSLLVHVDGTRVQTCRHRVADCSGLFLRLALALDMPIVPVRFRGGLPVRSMDQWFDFPFGYGRQDYWIGRPIPPSDLAPLDADARRTLILDRLNSLGGAVEEEQPSPPALDFSEAVERAGRRWSVPEARAVIVAALAAFPVLHPEIGRLVRAMEAGRLLVPDTAEGRWLGALGAWLSDGGLEIGFRSG